MEIGAMRSFSTVSEGQHTRARFFDSAASQRKDSPLNLDESNRDEKKVNPEEILDKIKDITQNGQYSVRFEKVDKLDEIVVKVVDTQTEEVIRQIPPEEILGVKQTLREFRGMIIDSES